MTTLTAPSATDTPTDISQAVGFDHVPAAVRLNACSAVIAAGRIHLSSDAIGPS